MFSQTTANVFAAAKKLQSKLLKRKHAKFISLPKEKRIRRLWEFYLLLGTFKHAYPITLVFRNLQGSPGRAAGNRFKLESMSLVLSTVWWQSCSRAAQTQPSHLPRSESPHWSLPNGYLQFRGASCGWTLSPLANLILLLALLPSTVVGPLAHWKPPLRVRSYLGVVVLGQLSCRTSSARKRDWGQHNRGITKRHPWDVSSQGVQRDQQLHHPIRVLLSFLRKNAPTKQAIMKIQVPRDPVLAKDSSS